MIAFKINPAPQPVHKLTALTMAGKKEILSIAEAAKKSGLLKTHKPRKEVFPPRGKLKIEQ